MKNNVYARLVESGSAWRMPMITRLKRRVEQFAGTVHVERRGAIDEIQQATLLAISEEARCSRTPRRKEGLPWSGAPPLGRPPR
jgi:hypothetical protein